MIIQILTHIAAFFLGGLTVFGLFVYAAYQQRRRQPETINESRKMGENVLAVLNPGDDALQRTIT